MAEITKNGFKIYATKDSDITFSKVYEGFCERFDNNINRYGKSFSLTSKHNVKDKTVENIMNDMIANNVKIKKIEVYGADNILIFTTASTITDYNYSVLNSMAIPSYEVSEVLRFNMI